MQKLIFIILLFSAFSPVQSWARRNSWLGKTHYLSAGAGATARFNRHYATAAAPTSPQNSLKFRPFIAGQAKFFLSSRFQLIPELGFVFPNSGQDENINIFSYFFNFQAAYTVLRNNEFQLNLRLGPGFYFTRVSSSGGSELLDNGVGQDNFPLPDGGGTSRNLIIIPGLEITFPKENISLRFDYHLYNAFDSAGPGGRGGRAEGYSLSLFYNFRTTFWNKHRSSKEKL